MRQVVEYSFNSLSKAGEELCGDSVIVRSTRESFVAVLSDGLGSGVKASILSTLTAEIAARLFESGLSVEEIMQTIVETLPECNVRKMAYATFSVLVVKNGRHAHLVEFDSPPLIVIRDNEIFNPEPVEREVRGRRIREARFELRENDNLVLISDGYEHAGLGGMYRFGWGWDNIAMAVQRLVHAGIDTYKLMRSLSKICMKLYDDKPGDDSTVITMKVRPARYVTVLTGPPANRELDAFALSKLTAAEGSKIICGGSTAQMAARIMEQKLEVEWVPPRRRTEEKKHPKKGSPPTALLQGIDLVTEGILTLGQTIEIIRGMRSADDLPKDQDAATRLAQFFTAADDIHFIVGTAINPNQVADIIRGEPMRMVYIRELVKELQQRNKEVTVERI